jgi:hypothetical protein
MQMDIIYEQKQETSFSVDYYSESTSTSTTTKTKLVSLNTDHENFDRIPNKKEATASAAAAVLLTPMSSLQSPKPKALKLKGDDFSMTSPLAMSYASAGAGGHSIVHGTGNCVSGATGIMGTMSTPGSLIGTSNTTPPTAKAVPTPQDTKKNGVWSNTFVPILSAKKGVLGADSGMRRRTSVPYVPTYSDVPASPSCVSSGESSVVNEPMSSAIDMEKIN